MMSMFSTVGLKAVFFAPADLSVPALGGVPETASGSKHVTLFNTIPIKRSHFAENLEVMAANTIAARDEVGALSFDVFQPESGEPTLFLLEHWADQASLDGHMTMPHLKAVQARLETDIEGIASSEHLTAVPGLGPDARKPFSAGKAATSRNVLVRFTVKPEQEKLFIKAFSETTAFARRAPGNHAFELYRIDEHKHTYLLFERWEDASSHEAHLAQDYSKRLGSILPDTLAGAVIDGQHRFLVSDVVPEN